MEFELTSDEQGITSENDLVVTILHEVADTVLRVAWRVQRLDRDALSNLEHFTMGRGLGDRLAVLASNDG